MKVFGRASDGGEAERKIESERKKERRKERGI